jgi:hypothetical protein
LYPAASASNDSVPTRRPNGSKCCSDVSVEVGIDTTRDPEWSFYDGHGHPFLP